jgi:hypothetical protein
VNRSRSGHLRRGPSTAAVRRIPIAVLAFVVLMILPPAATAASGADPSNPSLDQYVESVPTSDGSPPPGGGSSQGHLSDSMRHRIAVHGGSDARQLEAIASSPSLGAPVSSAATTANGGSGSSSAATGTGSAKGGHGGDRRSGARPAPAAADHRPSGLEAVANSAAHGDGSSMGLLLVGLVTITALFGGTALARRRYDTT